MNYGINKIKEEKFPLCLRLLKEMHSILMNDVRGGEAAKVPGEFRKSQNWIGGSNPENALFVPPPFYDVDDLMGNLEKYFYLKDLPPLIKCAIIHYQFETIHPFCDGNGRLGRMLIILYLICEGLLLSPILYLSLYFKAYRDEYYDNLMVVRNNGGIKKWLRFFLKGIISTAKQVGDTTNRIIALGNQDKDKIKNSSKNHSAYSYQLLDLILKDPIVSIIDVKEGLDVTYPTARIVVKYFEDLRILKQISKGNRNKKYAYSQYIQILDEGCENL